MDRHPIVRRFVRLLISRRLSLGHFAAVDVLLLRVNFDFGETYCFGVLGDDVLEHRAVKVSAWLQGPRLSEFTFASLFGVAMLLCCLR